MSVVKDNFFKYIGTADSISGYSRSYKLVLYKILFDDIRNNRKSYFLDVAKKFRQFYCDRKQAGKVPDKNVDDRIYFAEKSTDEQVLQVILNNPYKYIHENGFLDIKQDERAKYFAFNEELAQALIMDDIERLSAIVDVKLSLYFSKIDVNEQATVITTETNKKNSSEYGDTFIKVNFDNIEPLLMTKFAPAVLQIDNYILKIKTWEEALKICLYAMGKTAKGEEYLTSLAGGIFVNHRGEERILKAWSRISFNDITLSNPVKFTKRLYVSCLKAEPARGLFDRKKFATENLVILRDVKEKTGYNFSLWLYDAQKCESVEERQNAVIAKAKKASKIKEIKVKTLIARINAEILSDEEKFYLKIEREFDKKILLGDIVISAEEDKLLKQYMTADLTRLDRNGVNFKPYRLKVFAFGLVRFAMKQYSNGTFWPRFKDEYGVAVKVNNQGEIHYWFQRAMRESKKTYDNNLPQKIDNISLHSFVTDKCAKQFFDYLFDFWRKELNRNIENMYGDGNDIFKELISEIKSNNDTGINNVMKHTSMALALNERSCKLRIRRFLKLMDECFWGGDVIPETGNRFNELLRKWMAIPNGKFQAEYLVKTRQRGVRGQKLLSKPQLQVQFAKGIFSLRLPQEILPHCTEEEHPVWRIESDGFETITVCPDLMQGAAFLYTEETETNIPFGMLFKRISMTLYSEKRKFNTFTIKADEVRFFKDDGKCVDHSETLPAGNLYCYSAVKEIPQILYKEKQLPQFASGAFVGVYQAEKGDIVLLHNNHAVQVGEKIYEGLNGEAKVDDAVALHKEVAYPIFSKLPKILFKAQKERVGGVAIMISGEDKPFRLTDHNYYEFKIDDNLDEIYAYIIDLNDFIGKEGCYQIGINVPNSQKQYTYNFCYIKDFSFKFDNAPYVFNDTGSISFNKNLNILMKGDAWEQADKDNRLNLHFNPDSPEFSGDYIDDWKVKLSLTLGSEAILLHIDIPIFLWKYKKEEGWSINKPADIFLKSLSNRLYVKGPFNFNDKSKNKLFLDLKNADNEDTDMFAESVKDERYYTFAFGNFKSWLNQDIVRRQIKLQLDGKVYPFVDVYCRSIVLSHSLTGDFEGGKLYGNFDVFGDSEYTISIKKDNEIIVEDIPLVDGKFELDTEITFGVYTVSVNELFEDDSGFESFNFEIGAYKVEIKDLKNLTQKTMSIKEIKDINGKYAPIQLNHSYRIANIDKTDFSTLQENDIEILGLWREDLSDEQLSEMPMYKCDIINDQGEKIKGLLVYYSRVDIRSAVLLERAGHTAVSLYYDLYRHRLISESQADNFKRYERYKRTAILQDDMYSFVIE